MSKFVIAVLFLMTLFLSVAPIAGIAMETAQVSPRQPEAAAGPVKVSVSAQCENGEAIFLVINEGDPWPVPSRITVYRTQGRLLVSQRLMRLTAGQRASFRVKGAAASQAEFGLFIEPAWYQRPFAYDATITCK